MSAAIAAAQAAIDAIHKAFGAPGDYGYGTQKGDALMDLYRSRGELSKADEVSSVINNLIGLLERVPSALNGAFSAGAEEKEGGSARRQERYAKESDELRREIPEAISLAKAAVSQA
jgi:hypothetical protein